MRSPERVIKLHSPDNDVAMKLWNIFSRLTHLTFVNEEKRILAPVNQEIRRKGIELSINRGNNDVSKDEIDHKIFDILGCNRLEITSYNRNSFCVNKVQTSSINLNGKDSYREYSYG